MGSMQTNIVEGTRAFSSFEWAYMRDGKQMPMKQSNRGNWSIIEAPKRGKLSLSEYLSSNDWNAYNKEWENTVDYSEVYNKNLNSSNTKKVAEKNKLPVPLVAQLHTVEMLKPKNEHVGPSATTHAERFDFVNNPTANINRFGDDHKTFWGPKFIMDKYLDAKIKDPFTGEMIDNKVSAEGVFRLIKFTGNKRPYIFNHNGNDVSSWITEKEGLLPFLQEVIIRLLMR